MRDHAWLHSTIVGWKSTIGRWTRLEGVSVLGEDVQISDEVIYFFIENNLKKRQC